MIIEKGSVQNAEKPRNNNAQNQSKKDEYAKYIASISPKTKQMSTMLKAFLTGGVICLIGQFLIETLMRLGASKINAGIYCNCILIVLAAALTGLSAYDSIAIFGGAGSTIPITGFSNAMVSPAMEYKSEGIIYGLSAKTLIVVGPVLINGIAASILVGLIYYVAALLGA
jgi:stage V sporulation protein AC